MDLRTLGDLQVLEDNLRRDVLKALDAMLASPAFAKAERPARFLRHLVTTALEGDRQRLKESVLGVDVFGKDPSWDPRLDPMVRQEAARLRKRIARYYEAGNPGAGLRIEIPVGGYVPSFTWSATEANLEGGPAPAETPVSGVRRGPGNSLRFALAATLLLLATAVVAWRAWAPPGKADHSIVVLPFTNLSASPADQYFADGLTDEITDRLAQLKSLRVVARSSAFQFKDTRLDIREVGRQLDVAYALEGSVERQQNRVKIRAHLERIADGLHIWSNTYERAATDLFAVQSELAAAIATRLNASVGGVTNKHVAAPEAHELYMQGRYELERMTPEAVARAEQLLQQAIDLDPQYAAAYYALGVARWNQTLASDSQVTTDAKKEAALLFRRALMHDPELADAHAGLANYAMQYDWDWARAERELRTAPQGENSVAVQNSLAFLLVFLNRFAEADEHIRRSQELDPVGSVSVSNRATMWNLQGRFSKSREEFQRLLQKSPSLIPAQYMIALTHIGEGRPELSLPILRELRQRTPVARMFEAMAAARAGRREEALSIMRPFEQRYPDPGVAIQWFALVYAYLGDEINTVKWLERSADRHEWQALNLAVHPAYASVRSSTAFQELKKRIGL